MEFVNTIGEAVLSSMEWVWARPWIYCVVVLVLVFVFLWDLVSGLSKKKFCSPRFVSLRNNFIVIFKRNCPCLIVDLDLL